MSLQKIRCSLVKKKGSITGFGLVVYNTPETIRLCESFIPPTEDNKHGLDLTIETSPAQTNLNPVTKTTSREDDGDGKEKEKEVKKEDGKILLVNRDGLKIMYALTNEDCVLLSKLIDQHTQSESELFLSRIKNEYEYGYMLIPEKVAAENITRTPLQQTPIPT